MVNYKMKKYIIITFCFILLFTLSGCNQKNKSKKNNNELRLTCNYKNSEDTEIYDYTYVYHFDELGADLKKLDVNNINRSKKELSEKRINEFKEQCIEANKLSGITCNSTISADKKTTSISYNIEYSKVDVDGNLFLEVEGYIGTDKYDKETVLKEMEKLQFTCKESK